MCRLQTWVGGCGSHAEEITGRGAREKICCPKAGQMLNSASLWVKNHCDTAVVNAEQMQVGQFAGDFELLASCQRCVRFVHALGLEKFAWLNRAPHLIAFASVRYQLLEQCEASRPRGAPPIDTLRVSRFATRLERCHGRQPFSSAQGRGRVIVRCAVSLLAMQRTQSAIVKCETRCWGLEPGLAPCVLGFRAKGTGRNFTTGKNRKEHQHQSDGHLCALVERT